MNYDNVKLCKKCKVNPALQQSPYCIECKRERKLYDKDYFKQHAVAKTESAVEAKRSVLKWYRSLKDNKMCLDCMRQYRFFQMDYDHVPGRGKKMNDVSKLVRLGYAREKIIQEINKCDLLCKNCHSLRTWQRKNGVKEF